MSERKKIFIFCSLFLFVLFIFGNNVYAKTDPTLVNKLNTALKEIQGYLVKLSTPAAGVAIASGALIRKFSFGDEEKMRIGKKVIINAIFCYGIILSLNLIIKFIETILK
ncbi:MAG: pilin [Clostridia bacterium]|nr:pilin [Clostridia bacterium]